MIDYDHVVRSLGYFNLQPKLLLHPLCTGPAGHSGCRPAGGVIGPLVPRNCPNYESSGAEGLSTWSTKLSAHETLSFHLLLLPSFCSTHHVALSPPISLVVKMD